MSPRNRPPRLETRRGPDQPAAPATPEQRLERAKVAGPAAAPGRTELRRFVERIVAGDRAALGELPPFEGLTTIDVWAAFTEVFGATEPLPTIDAARTIQAVLAAAARVRAVAATGARVAIATAAPASLLGVHLALARLARAGGATLEDFADVGPLRLDGRSARWLRWIDGVAVVTDGTALVATGDGEAAREWLFVVPRPSLVVADGTFAEVAWNAGVEVVALAGLARGALAIAAARRQRCTLVPLRTDRPPRAYVPVVAAIEASHLSPPSASL